MLRCLFLNSQNYEDRTFSKEIRKENLADKTLSHKKGIKNVTEYKKHLSKNKSFNLGPNYLMLYYIPCNPLCTKFQPDHLYFQFLSCFRELG